MTIFKTGEEPQTMIFDGKEYADALIETMPEAKQKNDRDTFSDINYEVQENNRVKITANRYSSLYSYDSPYIAVVGPSDSGDWLIWEETYEMQR